jgi:hypothetical protein
VKVSHPSKDSVVSKRAVVALIAGGVFLGPDGPLKEGYVFFAAAAPVAIACASYWLVERRFLRSTAGAANRSRPLVQPTSSVS